MLNSGVVKLQLVQDIINLPDDKLAAARDFLTKLVTGNGSEAVGGTKRSKAQKPKKRSKSRPAEQHVDDDPILKLFGIASYDPPVKSIDEELYGEM